MTVICLMCLMIARRDAGNAKVCGDVEFGDVAFSRGILGSPHHRLGVRELVALLGARESQWCLAVRLVMTVMCLMTLMIERK